MLEQTNFSPLSIEDLKNSVRTIEDFPKAGISFKDITTLLANPQAFQELVARMSHEIRHSGAQAIVGLEARGFIIGVAVAQDLGLPFIPARKPGKLPGETISVDYDLEYGSATLEVHSDSFASGTKVAIVDDLLATGGTATAAIKLVEKLGGQVSGCFFAIELPELDGRSNMQSDNIYSVMEF